MGGRGTNLDVHAYLRKSEAEQTSEFTGLGLYGNIKFLKSNSKSSTTPIFSHTPNRVYVVIGKKGGIKDIGIYGPDHTNRYVIHMADSKFGPHEHKGLKHAGHDPISRSHKNLINHVEKLYNEHRKEWNL